MKKADQKTDRLSFCALEVNMHDIVCSSELIFMTYFSKSIALKIISSIKIQDFYEMTEIPYERAHFTNERDIMPQNF